MTIAEAINRTDELKPNQYTETEKVKWLSDLDGMVYRFVISTHEGAEDIEWEPYTDDTSRSTELLVGEPFDEIYSLWMMAKIDFANGEYAKYNNSIIRYNDTYQAYQNHYNRTHMPLATHHRYF